MQSAYAGFFLPIKTVSSSQNVILKNSKSSDDTFMDMLSERISSAKISNNGSSIEKKAELFSRKTNALREEKSVAEPDAQDKKTFLASTDHKSSHIRGKNDKGVSEASYTDISADDGEKTKGSYNAENIESILALLQDLLAMLNRSVIEEGYMEDFDSQQAVNEVSPDLLNALASNLENLKALSADISLIPEFIQEDLGSLMDEISQVIGQNGFTSLTGLVVEVEKENASTTDVINRLKAQCSELIEKLKEGMPKSEGLVNAAQDSISEVVFDESESMEDSNADISSENSAKASTKPDAGTDKGKAVEHKDSVISKNDQVQDTHYDDSAILLNIQNPVRAMDEVAEKVPVSAFEKVVPKDVAEQVVMKVRLMAGENRQEMEMQLKPESLGKLTLKIVHERGEVIAKITAENEQVKSILEGSMQLLKDALEKSGVSVQSLSVSVGNKDEREPSNESDNTHNGRTDKVVSVNSDKAAPVLRNAGSVYTGAYGDYYDNGSQINLTA